MLALAKLAPGRGHVALTERPQPTAGPGEVVVEVHGAGVCGTDLHLEAGEYDCVPPVVLGHEVSGTVADVGEGVDANWLGARVVSETFFSTCGRCRWCRDGQPNLCPLRRSIGTHVDGVFAPRVVLPERNLHRIPDWLHDHAAALAEPVACVCNALLDPALVAPGDRVLVVGPGPVGLIAAQVARALGGTVRVSGLPADAARLAIAGELGLAIDAGDGALDEVDVAIEASGSAGGAAACIAALRRGGRCVQLGIFGCDVRVPLDLVVLRELALSSAFASTPRAWRRALALITRRAVELEPLVSDVAPLSDWQRAFDDARSKRALKVVLDPRLR